MGTYCTTEGAVQDVLQGVIETPTGDGEVQI